LAARFVTLVVPPSPAINSQQRASARSNFAFEMIEFTLNATKKSFWRIAAITSQKMGVPKFTAS
jgi:hypothetical protein